MLLRRTLSLAFLAFAAACGSKDAANDEAAQGAPADSLTEEEAAADYAKRQQAFADSVLNNTGDARTVVEKMGKGYAVASVRLRDTLALLSGQQEQCLKLGRDVDPYLAGTVSFLVNMSIIGSDIVRVQESKWTSVAGNVVEACLNREAKNWKFDGTFGKPAAYIAQVQFAAPSR